MLYRIIFVVMLACAGLAHAQNKAVELYQQAKTQAAAGELDAALQSLQQSAAAGFLGLQFLRKEEAFNALRSDDRFASILLQVRNNLYPCEEGEHFADFDFWVGSWDVFTGDGNKAGSNVISRVENGCALQELWTSAGGTTGRSLNFYDPNRGKWRQHWVSPTGLLIDIEGGLVDGSMVLEGIVYYFSGLQADFRGTWTPLEDGRVRQYFEQHDAASDSWQPWFEGFYVRTGE